MRLLLLIGLVLGTVAASAQSRVEVYPDDRMLWRDMLLHAENGVVREGSDWRGQVLWTTQPEKIFAGYSTSAFDLAYSVREGQLIQGDSYFSDAILYTAEVRGDELQVFIGDSTFPLDLVYTVRPHPFDEGTFDCTKRIASARSTAFASFAGCLLRRSFTRCSSRKGCCSA